MEFLATADFDPSEFMKIKHALLKVNKNIDVVRQKEENDFKVKVKTKFIRKQSTKKIKSIFTEKWERVKDHKL